MLVAIAPLLILAWVVFQIVVLVLVVRRFQQQWDTIRADLVAAGPVPPDRCVEIRRLLAQWNQMNDLQRARTGIAQAELMAATSRAGIH